jgi:hypothetical protein
MLCTPNLEYGECSIKNAQKYCDIHEYDFKLHSDYPDKSRPPSWSKILLTISLMDKYDWIFQKDADSLFYNLNKKLENYIEPNLDFIFSVTKVNNILYPTSYRILMKSRTNRIYNFLNAGHVLIKCTKQNKKRLEDIYNNYPNYINDRLWEQGAFQEMFVNNKLGAVKLYPKNIFNAYNDLTVDSFIMHLELNKDLKRFKKTYDFIGIKSSSQ